MPNIIKKENGKELRRREWDPFQMMREFFRDPFHEIAPIWPAGEAMTFAPDFEVKETPEAYVFKADVPGVKDKDIEITLTGNRLTIGGRREAEREEKGETFYACERAYGAFTRSFTLPDGVDLEHVTSALDKGVLTVAVPKKPEMQPKKIAVKAEEKRS